MAFDSWRFKSNAGKLPTIAGQAKQFPRSRNNTAQASHLRHSFATKSLIRLQTGKPAESLGLRRRRNLAHPACLAGKTSPPD
jgi:hypothetical protein